MSTVEFIRESARRLHGEMERCVSDLTGEQLHFRPMGRGNHIAYIIWHLARTEDNVVQRSVQRKPTIWKQRELDKRFGLDPVAQGTGMSPDAAGNLTLPSAAVFLEYMRQVWEATDSYLASIDDSVLAEIRSLGSMGEMPVRRLVGQVILTHGFEHLGEIQYVRGLLGLKGAAL